MNTKLKVAVVVVCMVLTMTLTHTATAKAAQAKASQSTSVSSVTTGGARSTAGQIKRQGFIAAWDNGGATTPLTYFFPAAKCQPLDVRATMPNGYLTQQSTWVSLVPRYLSNAKFCGKKTTKNGAGKPYHSTYKKVYKNARFKMDIEYSYQWWNTLTQSLAVVSEKVEPFTLGRGKLKRTGFPVTFPTCEQPIDEAAWRSWYPNLASNPGWTCNPPELTITITATIRKGSWREKQTIVITQGGIFVRVESQ